MISKRQDAKSQLVFLNYRRCTLYYCIAFTTLVVIGYLYVQTITFDERKTIKPNSWIYNQFLKSKLINSSRDRKLILLWTNYFSLSNWLPSTRKLQCPVQECDVVSDRSLLPNSSAIIMHWRNVDGADLPPECPVNGGSSNTCPVLVMFNKEAPPNTGADNVRKLNDRIHLMATYRKDSEIYAPYGKIVRRTSGAFKLPKLDPNRNTVCWLVSHCQTQSNREVYVNNLRLHVNVTIYGKCGTSACPYTNVLNCYAWLSERCKFYLSFENSMCKDYSTEKLYYAMMTNMVPIVMGGEDYSRYLPSHSFINVADYASPEELGRYLKTLDKDEDKYLEYFKWKTYFKAEFVPYEWLCDVCALLHSAKVKDLKPRRDMISWWYEDAHCGT